MPDESTENSQPRKEQPSENITIPPISKPAVGAATGAVIGSVAGPIGAVVGGAVGALAGKAVATGKPISTTAREAAQETDPLDSTTSVEETSEALLQFHTSPSRRSMRFRPKALILPARKCSTVADRSAHIKSMWPATRS